MIPAMAKERMTAGPALPAPTPIRVRMPVPTIAPTPSATRWGQDRLLEPVLLGHVLAGDDGLADVPVLHAGPPRSART